MVHLVSVVFVSRPAIYVVSRTLPVNETRPEAGSKPQDVEVQVSGKLYSVASGASISGSHGAAIIVASVVKKRSHARDGCVCTF